MTQLTPTLYAVEVPMDAFDFHIESKCIWFDLPNAVAYRWIRLPSDLWQILGTVTPDAIDFDCSFMVGDNEMIMDSLMHMEDIYDSRFRSLLTSKGCDLSKKYVIVTIKK